MTRQQRPYADIDAIFAPNPATGDIALRRNEAAVKFAIKNLVLTRNYERPFDSSIGSQVSQLLFDQMDYTTTVILSEMITQTITNHEPRVDLISVDVEPNEEQNSLSINIIFNMKNTERPLNVTFALERTR
jgi:phage baseplate assembly protein W